MYVDKFQEKQRDDWSSVRHFSNHYASMMLLMHLTCMCKHSSSFCVLKQYWGANAQRSKLNCWSWPTRHRRQWRIRGVTLCIKPNITDIGRVSLCMVCVLYCAVELLLTWEATMRPMPRSICCGEMSWVELPSPPNKLDVPTSVMPICSAQNC